MRRSVVAGLAASALALPAAAQEVSEGFTLNFQAENEFFIVGQNSDRYYTQGLQFSVLSPPTRPPAWLEPVRQSGLFLEKSDARFRWGGALGQNIYTPEDLTLADPDPRDRPYAGWMYLSGSMTTYSAGELNTLELQVGLVGPSALGGWAQNNWHKHVNHIPEAQGWGHELKDEVAFAVIGERKWRPTPLWPDKTGPISLQQTSHVALALGTLHTSAAAGAGLMFGKVPQGDFGPPRIRPGPGGAPFYQGGREWGLYGFANAEARLVARDLFLDGNTFRSSRSVDKRALVYEAQVGASFRWRWLRLAHAYVWRTEEFLGQNGHAEFANVSVTIVPYGD